MCLSRLKYATGASAVTVKCASGAAKQQWRIAGTSIRDGKLCLAAASAAKAAPERLSRCAKSPGQQWVAQGNGNCATRWPDGACAIRGVRSRRAHR
jgi:Ricin-type beta-trefoil lectin domain